jgi:GAF domain-containing protein
MTTGKDFFQTFCNLNLAFGTAATMDELLNRIVQSATEALSAKAACLFLADRKQDTFAPTAQFGLSDNYLHANPFKARKIVEALKKEGHLFFEDATADPRLEHHKAKKAEGIASILTVPVVVDNRRIGILSLYTGKKHDFTRQEIDFLKALAAAGGVAFKKSQLLERIETNATLFLELASAINSSLDIREVLHSISEKVCQALDMKGGTIRLLNEDGKSLQLVASYGLSKDFLDKGPISPYESITEGLKGKTIVIEDTSNDKRLQYPKETLKEGIKSIVSVPMRSREKVIGVMRLYSDCVRKYSRDFITMVEALAHTGALAIQNASMYLQLKEDKQNLEEEIWSHRLYF